MIEELRWCVMGIDGGISVHSKPTATDALEFAEEELKDADEFACCELDERLESMGRIKKLLNVV